MKKKKDTRKIDRTPEEILGDMRWTYFVLFLLNPDDGGVRIVKKEADGSLTHPLVEKGDVDNIRSGIVSMFKTDLDLLALFFGIVHQAVAELKNENLDLLPPRGGPRGEA